MSIRSRYQFGSVLACLMTVVAQGVWAVDITINDTMNSGGVYGTDGRTGVREDNEVEPGNQTGQLWDLEGFVNKNQKLYLIGGFNFLNGQSGNGMTFKSGDIFIDNNNNALWGSVSPTLSGGDGYQVLNNNVYKYNYVIDLNFNSGTPSLAYNIYTLDENTGSADRMQSAYYRQNDESNPWEYLGQQGTTGIAKPTTALASGNVDYFAGLSDAQILTDYGVSLNGGGHNVVGIDMSWYTDNSILTHFTFGCGNDSVVGELSGGFDVPDGGTTLMLLGLALTGLASASRKLRK